MPVVGAVVVVVVVLKPNEASALDNDSLPMLRSPVRLLGSGGSPCIPLLAILSVQSNIEQTLKAEEKGILFKDHLFGLFMTVNLLLQGRKKVY